MAKSISKSLAAALVYATFAVYLYHPYFGKFDRWRWLLVVSAALGSAGCYVLSRRWVKDFAGSLFAGACYGFGPFALSLAKFHPTASLLAATVPWLFCPAAFIGAPSKRKMNEQKRVLETGRKWLSLPLSVLPFMVIVVFFQVSAEYRLFAVPIQTRLQLNDVASLAIPLVMVDRNVTLMGFYHIPIAPLITGLAMLAAARKLWMIAILVLAVALACLDPLLQISPIIWLTVGTTCGAVIAGIGMQGLVSAGYADRKWILLAAGVTATFSIATLFLATRYYQVFAGLGARYARLFTETAKMYILGTLAVLVIFFLARAKSRAHWLRWAILGASMGLDIRLGATSIVDKIF
ncbi:MAG: hypothetical protein JSU70_20505 [Phycisphaerales bacterium]|nr:MAG: hypothetical protein JSU70_20505 [Phycisphaerales bacterium]